MTFDLARFERRLAALESNRGASLRFGTVTESSAAEGAARVQLADGQGVVSMPLRTLQPRTLKDKMQCAPDVGEQVACLFAGQGMEQGVVLGAMYSQADATPGLPQQTNGIAYADGARVEYDREAHSYIVDVPAGGSIVFRIGGSTLTITEDGITLNAQRIDLN